jgi:hypothetical protein
VIGTLVALGTVALMADRWSGLRGAGRGARDLIVSLLTDRSRHSKYLSKGSCRSHRKVLRPRRRRWWARAGERAQAAGGASAPGSRVRLATMRLEGIRAGDIVEVDRLGRRFHALVGGSAEGGLLIEPLDRRVTYRMCRPHEVLAHWAKRGRSRPTGEPLEPSPVQLELDTTSIASV